MSTLKDLELLILSRYPIIAFAGGRELDTATLRGELGATRPLSVTRAEEIAALRAWARDRTVPAS